MSFLKPFFRYLRKFPTEILDYIFRKLRILDRGRKDEYNKSKLLIPKKWKTVSSKKLGKKIVYEPVVEDFKFKVPGLRQMKRGLAASLLLINFVFSQFLLGAIGNQGQPMFLIFLCNSFILLDYLWKTRGK